MHHSNEDCWDREIKFLKISQGLSRYKCTSFLRLISVWAHSATSSFFHPRRGHLPYTKSLLKRFLNCKYSKKSFNTYVKKRIAQQFALAHWLKMLKENVSIRDKAMNLADWKKNVKNVKNVSEAYFWLGPTQAEQMAEGMKQLVTALGHRGLQKETGKLAILQPHGLLSPGELEQCW